MDTNREPKTLLLNARQPEISRCPFIMMTEPGGAYFDDEEVVGLRKYLQKGGFLWADDFWGEYAWSDWENAAPAGVAVGTVSHRRRSHRPRAVPRDVHASRSFRKFRASAFGTAAIARGSGRDARQAHLRAINDEHGRIMVLMTHNTDFGDSYEQEAADPAYFMKFSVPGTRSASTC